MKKLTIVFLLSVFATAALAQDVQNPGPCAAFGITAGTCIQGAGAGGTPSSITLTNGTGLPIAGTTGYGTGVAALLGGAASGTAGPAGKTNPQFSGGVGIGVAASGADNPDIAVFGGGEVYGGSSTDDFRLGSNVYITGSTNTYKTTNPASFYFQTGGTHRWSVAPSGTAGTAITFTEAARIGSDRSFLVGTTTNAGAGAISNTGPVFHTGLLTDSGLTDRTVCQVVSTGELKFGSGTLGICLGTSSRRFKTKITPLSLGLSEILRMKPVSFYLNKEHGDPKKKMYGFIAEDEEMVLPDLVGKDIKGRPTTFDYLGVVPVLVGSVKQTAYLIGIILLWNLVLTGFFFSRYPFKRK